MLERFFYERALPMMPDDLKQVLDTAYRTGVEPELDDEQDEMYTQICGVAPGLVEAYATLATRDARLGAYASYVEFVPASYDDLVAAGLTARNVAVGHRIGEPGFEEVLRAIAGEIAAGFLHSAEPTAQIVVGRRNYVIDRVGHVLCAIPVYGDGPSDAEYQATAAWLQREFGPQLNLDQKPPASEARND